MVRPDDLSKLFKDGLPFWITDPPKHEELRKEEAPPQPQPTPTPPIGLIHIEAVLGIVGTCRFYAFFAHPRDREQAVIRHGQETTVQFQGADDMQPLGKYPGLKTEGLGRQIWKTSGEVESGTIIKAFCGFTLNQKYGMVYMRAVQDARIGIAPHPEDARLRVAGNLVEMSLEEIIGCGLRPIPRSRSNVMMISLETT